MPTTKAEEKDKGEAAQTPSAKAPAEVRTVAHERDREIIESRDIYPEGVLIVDEKTYCRVARVGEFFNPESEASSYRPPLDLRGLKGEPKANVQTVLSEGGK